MRSWTWILPVIVIAAFDWLLRWDKAQLWNVQEIAFYGLSCLYVLTWGWLLARLAPAAVTSRRTWVWVRRVVLVVLSVLSGFMLLVHISHYRYFGIHPTVIAFGYLLQEPRETLTIVADQLTPLRQAALLGLIVLMGGAWRLTLGPAAASRHRLRGVWPPLLAVVLLTPAFHNNVAMSQGNFLPSVNFIFSASKAAEFWVKGEGSFRRLQAGNRIELPAQSQPLRHDLLVIVSESLRAPSVHYLGYGRDTTPRQDALFRERPQRSFVFRQCYANSTATSESVPSLTTGVHPIEDYRRLHRLPLLFEYAKSFPDTVTFLLSAHAYDVANYRLFFQSKKLDHLYYQEVSGHPMYNSIGMNDAFLLPELRRVLQALTPQQHMAGILHLNSTHHPYRVPEQFERWGTAQIGDRYDNSIAYQDDLIGQVLDMLRSAGRLDNTIVTFTSDHGEGFGEHGVYGHRRTFYEEIIHVPCWMLLPQDLASAYGEALRSNATRNVSNLDLTPTVVDLLGLNAVPEVRAITDGMWGRSLLRPVDAQRPILGLNGFVNSRLFEGFVLLRGSDRFLLHQEGGRRFLGRYDLSSDPEEQRNLWPQHPAQNMAELQHLLERYPELHRLMSGVAAKGLGGG